MKKDLIVKIVDLENTTVEWVCKMWKKKVCITDDVIIEKVRRVQRKLNAIMPHAKWTNLHFNNGWLTRFKSRNSLKGYRSHGETKDVNENEITTEIPILRTLISALSRRDQFNADKFGLYYWMTPNNTIESGRIPGRKKRKERLNFLTRANADGCERVCPLVIGPSHNSRCFDGTNALALGFYYRSNKNCCINRLLFYEWLHFLTTTLERHLVDVLYCCWTIVLRMNK